MLHKGNQFECNFVQFLQKQAMFTQYSQPYSDEKKNVDKKNSLVSSIVSENTIGFNISLIINKTLTN